MVQVSAEEAKTHLSDLIAKAINGEVVLITEGDNQTVQLVPFAQVKRNRQPGTAKGLIHMADDFDAPLEDFKEYME